MILYLLPHDRLVGLEPIRSRLHCSHSCIMARKQGRWLKQQPMITRVTRVAAPCAFGDLYANHTHLRDVTTWRYIELHHMTAAAAMVARNGRRRFPFPTYRCAPSTSPGSSSRCIGTWRQRPRLLRKFVAGGAGLRVMMPMHVDGP